MIIQWLINQLFNDILANKSSIFDSIIIKFRLLASKNPWVTIWSNKAMIAHLLKMKLDNFQSLIVDPASITVIDFDGESARLIAYNDTSSKCEKFAQAPKSMKALLGGGSGSKSRRAR